MSTGRAQSEPWNYYFLFQVEEDIVMYPRHTNRRPIGRVSCHSELSKRSQSKHETETDLEGHVIVNGTAQVNVPHMPLHALHGDEVVAFASSILPDHNSQADNQC